MKNYFFIPLFFVVLLLSNCTASRCDLVDCNNGGVCEDGTCICETGYYGDFCDQTWISRFIGTYIGESKCVERQFNSTFQRQTSTSGIVKNFENTGDGLDVMMVNQLRFEFEEMLAGNKYTGYGVLQSDLSIKLVYTAERNYNSPGYTKEYCNIVLEKL